MKCPPSGRAAAASGRQLVELATPGVPAVSDDCRGQQCESFLSDVS